MYEFDTEEYDEDDFFYHMYFDEVSTTPLPDEFYDILESVSAGANPAPAAYPDYFDYFLTKEATRLANEDEVTTETSSRQNKNKRYLRWKTSRNQTRPRSPRRRNSKYMKSIKHGLSRPAAPRPSRRVARSRRSPGNGREVKRWEKQLAKLRRRRRRKLAGKRFNWSGSGRGIIGILDRRVPAQFRQTPFITISLASFIILSTGVTTCKSSRQRSGRICSVGGAQWHQHNSLADGRKLGHH
jgi:hypothetical protein